MYVQRLKITNTGKPYFICERSSELFGVLSGLVSHPVAEGVAYCLEGDLRLGKDIREMPTRGLNLEVEIDSGTDQLDVVRTIIEECRRFGDVAGAEYAGVEIISGNFISMLLWSYGGIDCHRVVPRIFEKV